MEYIVNSAAFNFYWDLLLREISGTCVRGIIFEPHRCTLQQPVQVQIFFYGR
jgi:hypothetical protein